MIGALARLSADRPALLWLLPLALLPLLASAQRRVPVAAIAAAMGSMAGAPGSGTRLTSGWGAGRASDASGPPSRIAGIPVSATGG